MQALKTSAPGTGGDDRKQLVRLHFRALESGDIALARSVVAPDHVNQMAADEPPACALPGPAGFLATSAWLRLAFTELAWSDLEYVEEGESVVARVRMTAVHAGPFVAFPPGKKPEVFPATGRRVDVTQAHFFRFRGAQSIEHVAVRDDLHMMIQLGFIPPSPRVAFKLAWSWLSGQSARAVAAAIGNARDAAASVAA